jgi:protein TonB
MDMKSKLFSLKTVTLLVLAMMFLATGVAQPKNDKVVKAEAFDAKANDKQAEEKKIPDVVIKLENLAPTQEKPTATPVQAAKISFSESNATVNVESDLSKEDAPYYTVTQMPVYNDKTSPLHLQVTQKARYPAELLKDKVQGIVIVQVIVEKDGSFTNAKVISSVHPKLDEEALKAVAKLDKGFTPAKEKDEVVRCYYQIPVAFLLPPR